ncbi:hypothetical protein [Filimonas effusa]|uniref:Uncharacterized protein n=1 Tax=Filimonas effusa TaxID=2508721 RepID=A0A4Q1D937_9BACT|nr:hypothetical protein [Filimonas effusa]RXK85872.1 hypothetical protein ESB13_03415 [Filimonas effusa]
MYKYYYRKAYMSGTSLIEFFKGTGRDGFFTTVFAALSSIHPTVKGVKELWLNDEVVFSVNSDLGNFMLSKNIDEHSCIMADGDSVCIEKIEQLLAQHPQFELAVC